MTVLAYLADSNAGYVLSFRALVTGLPPGGVVLDRTYFYPTGGGQPCDRGTIELDGVRYPVVEVSKTGPSVIHRLGRPSGRSSTAPGLRIGAEVTGEIDGARRAAHRQAHTAQHLLSARIFALTRLRTRAASIRAGGGRVDLEGAWPTAPTLAEVETDVNDVRQRPVPSHIRFLSRAEWESAPDPRTGLVLLPPQVDPVRLIELAGVDRCPCGGTHVRSTEEIGALHLATAVVPGTTATRIEFTLDEAGPPTPTG
ncbi:MAG: alanyl-tRNA editing protein [Thermoplasmata archaeon]|nr:alanyl-tRNA editing protein [Thermoplasmata archaeon]